MRCSCKTHKSKLNVLTLCSALLSHSFNGFGRQSPATRFHFILAFGKIKTYFNCNSFVSLFGDALATATAVGAMCTQRLGVGAISAWHRHAHQPFSNDVVSGAHENGCRPFQFLAHSFGSGNGIFFIVIMIPHYYCVFIISFVAIVTPYPVARSVSFIIVICMACGGLDFKWLSSEPFFCRVI